MSTNQADAISAVEDCIRDIRQWMLEDKLIVNDDKTEVLLVRIPKHLAKTSIESITFGEVDVKLVNAVRDLRAWLDTKLTTNTDINETCSDTFCYLHILCVYANI